MSRNTNLPSTPVDAAEQCGMGPRYRHPATPVCGQPDQGDLRARKRLPGTRLEHDAFKNGSGATRRLAGCRRE